MISAVKKVAIDEGCRENITEEIVDRVILKEIKSVKEQLDGCPESRTDLLEEYQARYDIFQEYAPKMLSAEEVEAFITERFAEIVAGSIVVEQVFGLPGVGRLLISSISTRDLPVVQILIMYITAVVIIVYFLVDILYRVIDPRISRK